MFKKMLKFTSIAVLIGVLGSPLLTRSFAQEDTGLSEDEIALLDRVQAAIETLETTTKVAVAVDGTRTFNLAIGEENSSTQTVHETSEGYNIQEEDGTTNLKRTFTIEYTDTEPEDVAYTMSGEYVFLDGVLYLNAGYDSVEGNVEEIAEGWQMVASAEELPNAVSELGLDVLFDEEDSPIINGFEYFSENAGSVELSEDELEDGTPIDVITIMFDKAGVAGVMLNPNEEPNEVMSTLFGLEESEGSMVVIVALDEEEHIRYIVIQTTIGVTEIEGGLVDPELEGVPFTLTFDILAAKGYAGYDEEFDPITVPDLEATEE